MLSLTSCSHDRSRPPFAAATVDDAKLRLCLNATVTVPRDLPPLVPITVPAGTMVTGADGMRFPLMNAATVVPFDVVLDREGKTAAWIIDERAAHAVCRSAARYVLDFNTKVRAKD